MIASDPRDVRNERIEQVVAAPGQNHIVVDGTQEAHDHHGVPNA